MDYNIREPIRWLVKCKVFQSIQILSILLKIYTHTHYWMPFGWTEMPSTDFLYVLYLRAGFCIKLHCVNNRKTDTHYAKHTPSPAHNQHHPHILMLMVLTTVYYILNLFPGITFCTQHNTFHT